MDHKSDQPMQQIIRAPFALQIAFLDRNAEYQRAGSTIASRAVQRPAAEIVIAEPVQPLSAQDWEALFALLAEGQVQGLSVEKQMTDELLERVAQLGHVKYLNFSAASKITDQGLGKLARLSNLEHLTLNGAAIGDAGLAVLREFPRLKTCAFPHQKGISDTGVAHLAACNALERVNLMGTQTGDGAIAALAGKAELREFFAGNLVGDAGLARLHEFPVFKHWQGGEEPLSLMEFRAHPNYLWLNLKAPLSNHGLAHLVGLDGLYALNLFGGGSGAFDATGSTVSPEGLQPLTGLRNLRWLGCNERLCTDEAMRYLGALPGLRFLMCQDAVAGDDGFAALARSQSLEFIWGRRCHQLTGRGFAALAGMPKLSGLSVSCKNVADAGLSALPRFRALKTLMPMDVPDEGFRHVGACPQLETLICMYCTDTTDRATAHLAGLKNLKTYQAWSTQITDRSLEILGRMPSLEKLLFSGCKEITDAGVAALAALPRLTEVTLELAPKVSPAGAAVFPAHVAVNMNT